MSKEEIPAKEPAIESLIEQVQNGSAEQYGAVVRIYQQPIYRYCLRMLGNSQDAEDAAQDIFVKAFESIHHYRRTYGFPSWLYRIAYHHCLNVLRKKKYQSMLPKLFRPEMTVESPEPSMDNKLFSPQLAAALASLSAEERSLLILRVFEEKSYAELGDIAGCSPEAAKKRIGRIKAKLRLTMLKRQEEDRWEHNPSHQSIHLKM